MRQTKINHALSTLQKFTSISFASVHHRLGYMLGNLLQHPCFSYIRKHPVIYEVLRKLNLAPRNASRVFALLTLCMLIVGFLGFVSYTM